MKFVKMHGAGNDFVMLGEREAAGVDLAELAVRMCDRHFGVGADGLITVTPSKSADFRMRIFNPDGSEPEMCGNGIRCAARYFLENGAGGKPEVLSVETMAGIRQVRINTQSGGMAFTVDMGAPVLDPELIPVKITGERVVAHPVEVAGRTVKVTCVSMGNPHAVMFYDEEVSEDEVKTLGPAVEKHPMFPARTNVEFVHALSDTKLRMRVWERGAGVTLACGTGACATLVAANLNGLTGRKATVHLPGGDLLIEWTSGGTVEMTGPAENVFTGDWPM
jgi:diaminopimelate epimerase